MTCECNYLWCVWPNINVDFLCPHHKHRLATEYEEQKKEIERLQADNDQLLQLTRGLDEHPNDYDGPCLCKLCVSYAD